MANFQIATGDADVLKLVAKEVSIEAADEIMFGRYMGKGPNNIIEVRNDLIKGKGDQITTTLFMQLSGGAITGDSKAEDNEEVPTRYTDAVTIDQRRNAVRLDGLLSEQRPPYDMRPIAVGLLKDWLAQDIDSMIMTNLLASPNRILYQGTATTTATLTATDLFDLNLVAEAKVMSELLSPMISPVRRGGEDLHLCIMSPHSRYDLKVESGFWNSIQMDARARGDRNPMFTGSLGLYDGTILASHKNISTTTNWGSGSNVNGANNVFLGRQAGLFAWAKMPFAREKEFDYANQTGFLVGYLGGHTKLVYNSLDFGVLLLRSARTNVAAQSA